MHPQWKFLAAGLFAPLLALAGTVYKWTDADGVVHYSDQPQPGAEALSIGTVQTLPLPGAKSAAGAPGKAQPEQKKPPVGLGYTTIKITTPAAGKTFTDEPIAVNLELSPGLQQGHTVIWYLNDSPLGETDTAFTLERLDRGSYTLYATVADASGAETVSSPAVTFYVRQPSMLAPQNPRR